MPKYKGKSDYVLAETKGGKRWKRRGQMRLSGPPDPKRPKNNRFWSREDTRNMLYHNRAERDPIGNRDSPYSSEMAWTGGPLSGVILKNHDSIYPVDYGDSERARARRKRIRLAVNAGIVGGGLLGAGIAAGTAKASNLPIKDKSILALGAMTGFYSSGIGGHVGYRLGRGYSDRDALGDIRSAHSREVLRDLERRHGYSGARPETRARMEKTTLEEDLRRVAEKVNKDYRRAKKRDMTSEELRDEVNRIIDRGGL